MKASLLRRMALSGLMALAIAAVPATAFAQTDNFPAHAPSLIIGGDAVVECPSFSATSITIPAARSAGQMRLAVSERWLTATLTPEGIEINIDANPNSSLRTAVITATNAAGQSIEINVTQPGNTLLDDATDGVTYVIPSSATDTDHQGGSTAALTIDGNFDSMYHSNWAGYAKGKEPVLTYLFNDGTTLEQIRYTTRKSGVNGNFGKVEVSIKTSPDGQFTRCPELDRDFGMTSGQHDLNIPESLRSTTFYGVQFKVMTGASDKGDGLMFASCAEMQFVTKLVDDATKSDLSLFADAICSALKPGVSQEQVNAMHDPFLKTLAQQMLNGEYSSEGRVAEVKTYRNLQNLSNEFNAPGKLYDQVNGVTGVKMTQGRHVIYVEGIPEHMGSTELRIIGWTVEEGRTFTSESFTVRNGVNIIERNTPWDGLAYIANYDDEGFFNGTGSTIRAHFVGAPVNGVLRPTMTNDEIKKVLDNATYTTIDLLGQRVHSVWEVEALKQHTAGQWVRYINTLDLIILWEHRLLGLEKYNRIPPNQTLAYVNYNYYMYQGGFGVTFKYDTQYRTVSPDNITKSDDDVLWGLSHEWGHQHQMAPYFRWSGMAEVTNNVFSAYNVLHMGYPVGTPTWRGRFPSQKWLVNAPKIFLDDNYNREVAAPKLKEDGSVEEYKTANKGDNLVLSLRDETTWSQRAASTWDYCPELVEFAQNQPKLPALRTENPAAALNAIEAYSGNNGELILAPWVMLQYYFGEKNVENRKAEDYFPDLWPDFFESLRQCDDEAGSTIEKKDGVDKYELLVSAFNGNKNGKRDVFRSSYPNSVWTSHNYLPADRVLNWQNNSVPAILNAVRKMSRLTRYNLFEYFQRWGVFTVCALEQGDYGIQHYVLTQEMYDEFKADMKALEDAGVVRPLPAEMVNTISYSTYPSFETPDIPNDRPLRTEDF